MDRVICFALITLVAFTVSNAQFSPPKTYDGFVYGVAEAQHPVALEAYFDLTCPDCLAAWPVIKRLTKVYNPNRLSLIVHAFSAPFHQNSFVVSRSVHTVKSLNASLTFDWIEAIFANQARFSNQATWQQSPEQVVRTLSQLANTSLLIDAGAFLQAFYTIETDLATRSSFKYGCSRGVVATPTFAVNGVTVPGADETWSIYDWRALLEPLVPPKAKPGPAITLPAAGVVGPSL